MNITTTQAQKHLTHSTCHLKASDVPVGTTFQFGPYAGSTIPYYFTITRVSADRWVENTTHSHNYNAVPA